MIDTEMIEAMPDEDIQDLISELSKTLAERKKVRYGLALNLFEKALRDLATQYPEELAIEFCDDDYRWIELLGKYNETKHTLFGLRED